MHPPTRLVTTVLLVGLLISAPLVAQETKIKRKDLPAPVLKTVAEQAKGAIIRGFSKEREKGKTYYEAELTINNHRKDILMDEQGKIVEIEEEVSLDSLPPAAKEGLLKAARSGKISKVESLTKNGILVAYEAVVRTGTKRSEIQVGPDGKKLVHPE